MTHTTRIPIRWGDLDALGHLNNATYLTLCEQARIEMLADVGAGDWDDAGPVLAAVSLQFRRPIHYPATAVVRTTLGTPGRSSLPFTYAISVEGDEDTTYAEGEGTLVWVNTQTGASTALPAPLREAAEAPAS
ncbi:thioesterase family protein [Rubrivirga sp. S365]|uniref:Thioesterase family protein n=1 Tax=Rubrivirga litoralis TaxID=3075598 RepID=A0ABU3BN80_9BACT|nr:MULTISPECIES: thioesterase family protein [unclassified Rubrivirga]MDT0630681.1 thioesterase family protein [Rubrivirga sp. F394]MDT7856254.1 thioesterase family protein [Rubrivirga sp. S365]